MCGRKIQKRSIEHKEFVAIVETLLQELDNNEVAFVVTVAQRLWLRRNVVVHGGTLSHLSLLISNASKFLEFFRNANSCLKTRVEVDHNTNLKWLAPLSSFVKVNWDAAADRCTRNMGIRVIIRDCQGKVSVTLYAPKSYIIDPRIAEAIVALRTTTFCTELGHLPVVLDGDTLQMVQALRKEDRNLSKIWPSD
jgi:hypothetical protein